MSLIVDIECYVDVNNEYVVKEMAMKNTSTGQLQCIIFAPPYPFDELPRKMQQHNMWIYENIHRIPWDSGSVPYDTLKHQVESAALTASSIYAKGHEKCKLLKKLFNKKIIDLNTLQCPSPYRIEGDYHGCFVKSHEHLEHCALRKCLKLSAWLCKNNPI